MTEPVSVIVPARNEAQTIEQVVSVLGKITDVDEVVVIDNGSCDATAKRARNAGAVVISEPCQGMGHAVRAGLFAARNDWIMKVDADLDKFDTELFSRMPAARAPGVGLVKGAWNDPKDNMPMTRLLVTPALKRMFPGLAHLRAPNSGLYAFDKSRIAHAHLTGDYAVDIDVMLRVHAAGLDVIEVDIGAIEHDSRDVDHYNGMAEEIFSFFLSRQNRNLTNEMVVVARDGAEVICNALAALVHKVSAGVRASIYVDAFDTEQTRVLQRHLAPFPTARVLPLPSVKQFVPHTNATGLCILAPYPKAGGSHALGEAIMLYEAHTADHFSNLWLMPTHEPAREISRFIPETVPDVSDGVVVKEAALGDLARMGHPVVNATREVFQSYASLPDALRPSQFGARTMPSPSVGNL